MLVQLKCYKNSIKEKSSTICVCKYSETLDIILYNKMAPEYVFSAWTEQHTSRVIVCSVHFEQFLVRKAKYSCAADGGFWFEELDRDYCYSCIKHYLKKMAQNCRYKVLNNEWFFSFGVCFLLSFCIIVFNTLREESICGKNFCGFCGFWELR